MKGKPSHKRQCLADRLAHSERFSGLLAEQGLSHPEAAKLLHVSLRTLQNWLSGKHQIPYMAFKLLRLLRYMELPGKSWQGWHFSRGMLVTPEGRTITGHEGAWWSLLVRQAKSFGQLYRERIALNASFHQADSKASGGLAREAGAPLDAGLVPFKTSLETTLETGSQPDVIMTSWPILCDFPTPSTLPPEAVPTTSASALTPSFASPLTPTCDHLAKLPQPLLPILAKPPGSIPHPEQISKSQNSGHLHLSSSRGPNGRNSPASSGSPEKASARAAPPQAGQHASTGSAA